MTRSASTRPGARRRRVLFAGAYGVRNAGDDLPLIVMCRELRRRNPDLELDFRALARFPADWEQKSYGVRMIRNPEYGSREEAAGKWFRGFNAGDDPRPLLRLRSEFERADLVVLGAGNWITDLSLDLFRGPIPLLASYVFLAQMHRVPVLLYGVSSVELSKAWARDLTAWIVRAVDVATVRDEESRRYLEGLSGRRDVHRLPDPALLGEAAPSAESDALWRRTLGAGETRRPIALGVRSLDRVLPPSERRRVRESVLATCRGLLDRHPIVFLPQCTYPESDDRVEADWYARRLAHPDVHVVRERLHPEALIALYARSALTVAIRLHAAVFSVSAGTPTLAIDYLPKVGSFMHGVGQGDACLGMEALTPEALQQKAEALLERPPEAREEMLRTVARLRAQVPEYARLASELLRRGGADRPATATSGAAPATGARASGPVPSHGPALHGGA